MPEDLSQSTVTPTITVHIEGAVARPGIVMLSQGARAHEAIQAAGGATREAALREINLARVLSDGEYFYVPHIGEEQDELPAPAQAAVTMGRHGPSAGNAPAEGTGTTAQGCVDINTADVAGLQVLKGVGPALAQRILEAREQRGAFESIDDVDAISGIGPAMLRKIEPQLCALHGR
ncbi:ComEA family DNA-binding protein [Schaalia canis]|uniref:ComEA family DNA-binding protein n=2 Tax=Schaalia canis TaxID=100469 RepID=A0A3P1SC15_9ACTO|nr:ComEA family DNA-binding protein [Schaalia canis]